MSYLLIGNISALISNDCVEPLVNARIRVYLPAVRRNDLNGMAGIFNDMRALSAREVLMKADQLLAEAVLDEKGNFSLLWDEVHLFTEELEVDLCLDRLPGSNGILQARNFHLSRLMLPWKRHSNGYVGAYAYVIPAAIWRSIYARAGAWVIAGVVKHRSDVEGRAQLKVEAYNAVTGHVIGHAHTREKGRYIMHFSRRQLERSAVQSSIVYGPDVYFKIYRDDRLLWAENKRVATTPERKNLGPCSQLNIIYRPSRVRRASEQIGNWLNEVIARSRRKNKKSENYRLLTPHSLI
ncbi:hypothetical protein [Chitinophaga sp. 212800010-3]|uniref:hypothetical protein n=1 Tax=unclassified Chitinophaga TaxID=2619133 RepID=UPI002DEAB901|nr:Carboxypeptidase regulatory-like domain-containing protein [Chitinophaga sp. 212800010-3]